MLTNKALRGALIGAVIAVIWMALGGGAVLLVIGLAALGGLIGMILQRPDVLIGLLERLRDR